MSRNTEKAVTDVSAAGSGIFPSDSMARAGMKRGTGMNPAYHCCSVNDMYVLSCLPIREDEKTDDAHLKVLIGGAGSYIGTNACRYLQGHSACDVHTLDMVNLVPEPCHFEGYDTVLYVAGIAHRAETAKNAGIYFEVNYRLAVKAAKAAKKALVQHFIILSSMSVYGLLEGHITKDTKAVPESCYGKSKLAADEKIWNMRSRNFRVTILRPPMVYGNGCRGNYRLLRRAALLLPVFPDSGNERSMIYIGNLCAFILEVIRCRREGIFFPQNESYINTSEMLGQIAAFHGRKARFIEGRWISCLPLKAFRKAFGSLTYEKTDIAGKYGFTESVIKTEGWIAD